MKLEAEEMSEPGTRRKNATELAEGYAWSHRAYESLGVLVALALDAWLVVRLVQSPHLSGWLVPLALFLGMLTADFISGFLHWLFDSWGSPTTPIVGALAIRTFREHHVDQESITRHDYIETNGHNYALSIPFAGLGIYLAGPDATAGGTFFGMYMLACAFGGAMTSQAHKWAHTKIPPSYVRWMQKVRFIITPEHHAKHHTPPYDRNFCIIAGWLNGPLRAIRFFETLERVITAMTGAIPREDDIGMEKALETIETVAGEDHLAVPVRLTSKSEL